jgi:hypothetical protein
MSIEILEPSKEEEHWASVFCLVQREREVSDCLLFVFSAAFPVPGVKGALPEANHSHSPRVAVMN